MSTPTIPVIDFQKYGLHITKPELVPKEDLQALGNKVCHALETIGFCYLKNHGVQQEKVEEMYKLAKLFFCQPVEEKVKYAKTADGYSGWIGLENETLNLRRPVGDFKEAYNITSDCDIWPAEPNNFKELHTKFINVCMELANRLFDVISIGLNLEDMDFLRKCHTGQFTWLRHSFYPDIPDDKEVIEGQARLGEHSDYGTLTLLFQDLIGGLEVKTCDGDFIPATPIPGTIIVNIGDMMQRWTSDRLIATEHRILVPQSKAVKNKERQSIAFFLIPDYDVVIRCLDNSNKYEEITSREYINTRFYEKF